MSSGMFRLGGHELGLVTGALFAGLLVGQLAIEVRPEIKTIFLLLFLFANGYGAGPHFFRALKQEGFAPLLLTLVVCFTGLFMVWLMSRIMRLDIGYTAGLLSGSLTQSSAIGTATDAILGLPLCQSASRRSSTRCRLPTPFATSSASGARCSSWRRSCRGCWGSIWSGRQRRSMPSSASRTIGKIGHVTSLGACFLTLRYALGPSRPSTPRRQTERSVRKTDRRSRTPRYRQSRRA